MSTCTLNLFSGSNWELLPEKLLIVDNIEDYLATFTSAVVLKFQYIKNQLEVSIVINASQLLSQPKHASYRYVKVTDDDSGYIYYYYVKKASWTAQKSVRLDLVMDVLNTFKEGTHYTFKESTRIIREHKDRFIKREYSVIFNFLSAVSVGIPPSVNDEIYIAVSNDLSVPKYYAILTASSASSFTLKFDNIDMSELTTFVNAVQAAGFFVALCKDGANAIIFNDGEVSIASSSYEIYRNIDEIPENINPMLQCGDAKGVKIENNKSILADDWYLLYRNQQDPSDSLLNPVECYLIPGTSKKADSGIVTAGRLDATSLQMTYWYAIGLGDKGYTASTNVTITLDNGVVLSPSVSTNDQRNVIIKRNADNTMTIYVVYGEVANNTGTETKFEGSWQCNYITFSSLPVDLRYGLTEPTGRSYDIRDKITGGAWLVGLLNITNNTNPAYVSDITEVDRTDPKNIKLIKLPYCPYDFTISGTSIVVSTDPKWDYIKVTQADGSSLYALKLNDLNMSLRSTLTQSIYSKNPIMQLKMSSFTPAKTDLRQPITFESKLFHSEFYQGTYVYDSFAFKIQLEKCDIDSYLSSRDLVIYFDMTRTINSKFLFTFSTYNLKNAESNYPKSLPIARNNEEVLYNVPYINYIRTGFNYDVKQKNLTNASNWIGIGLSAVSIGASLLMPSVPLKVAGVIGSLASMAVSIKGAVVSTIQGEENIKQKLLQAQNQTVSVAGSDDVDLMSVYAENRLKYLKYEPREVTKNLLFDLFFYAGYNSGRMGIPNHNTRINFDYLEADIVIQKITAIPQDCLNELINAFKTGVTYLHKTDRALYKWDFGQVYENWEKIFF